MGPTIEALMALQAIEQDLSALRRRKRARQRAVVTQQARIDQHTQEREALAAEQLEKRKESDACELQIKAEEEKINHLRSALNAAKTNKEYAAVLTDINSHRADNAKVEEQGLKLLGEVDALRQQIESLDETIAAETARLEEIQASIADEVAKLDTMIADLQAKRDEAAGKVPAEALALFDRMAEQYDGEAMAKVDVSGKKPPFTYTCGGCFMSLNAEHANALRSKDEVRQCDNCMRLLYMDKETM